MHKDIIKVSFMTGEQAAKEPFFEFPDFWGKWVTVFEVGPDFLNAFHRHMQATLHPMHVYKGEVFAQHADEDNSDAFTAYVDEQGALWEQAHFAPEGKHILIRSEDTDFADEDFGKVPDDAWIRPVQIIKAVLKGIA